MAVLVTKKPKKSKKKATPKISEKVVNSSAFVDDLFSQLKESNKKVKAEKATATLHENQKIHEQQLTTHESSTKMARKNSKKLSSKDKEVEEPSWLDLQLNQKDRRKPGSGSTSQASTTMIGKTAEGWPIYQEDDLVSLTGGQTKDCPFDCECCY